MRSSVDGLWLRWLWCGSGGFGVWRRCHAGRRPLRGGWRSRSRRDAAEPREREERRVPPWWLVSRRKDAAGGEMLSMHRRSAVVSPEESVCVVGVCSHSAAARDLLSRAAVSLARAAVESASSGSTLSRATPPSPNSTPARALSGLFAPTPSDKSAMGVISARARQRPHDGSEGALSCPRASWSNPTRTPAAPAQIWRSGHDVVVAGRPQPALECARLPPVAIWRAKLVRPSVIS